MTKNAKLMLIIGGVLIVGALLFKFLVADKDPGPRQRARGVATGAVVLNLQ